MKSAHPARRELVYRSLLKRTPLYSALLYWRRRNIIRRWRRAGRPIPPPAPVKQNLVRSYARRFKMETFVETGTFLGDMVDAVKGSFGNVHSIEIKPEFVGRARERFAGVPHVVLHQGDSATILPALMRSIRAPCLFWLDGHYSGDETGRGAVDSPVKFELLAILAHAMDGHVVLIDDARCFTGRDGYPTLEEIAQLVREYRPHWSCRVEDDIIALYPPFAPSHRRSTSAPTTGREGGRTPNRSHPAGLENLSTDYWYSSVEPTWSSAYLWPPVVDLLQSELPRGARIFEIGCGGGAAAGMLSDLGFDVTAIDPSPTGIRHGSTAFPQVHFAQRSAYEDLAGEFGTFDAVVSLEVVEHCFWPRKFAATANSLLKPGGLAVISTPFHGYWKNLALALAGAMDAHWSPLWDGGHIKFWSEATLRALLDGAGLTDIRFRRVGRLPPIAKSMIAVARKPAPVAGA